MTREQAEKAANVLIGVAVVGAAYYVLKDASLRRSAWKAARSLIAASGPWLVVEARRAWAASGGQAEEHGHVVTYPEASNQRDMMGA